MAVLAGVLSLRQGFRTLFTTGGRDDVAVILRPGATSEGESAFSPAQANILVKGLPEIATDEAGRGSVGSLCPKPDGRFTMGV